jgi:protein-S-isoprenylcysteine O-methyltransferase Ste14
VLGLLIRQLIAIAVLPFSVAALIPWWIGANSSVRLAIGSSAQEKGLQVAGCAALAIGLWLFVESVRYFTTKGRGTLAPWDPPRRLVVEGPYRYVRNPMISGVIFLVFGEALLLLSWPLARWAVAVLAMNMIYIPLLEEPMLEERFGEPYRAYRRRVRRFIPGRARTEMTEGTGSLGATEERRTNEEDE